MARNIITGIDIGSSSIRVVVAEKTKNGGLNIIAASKKDSEGIRRGYVTSMEDAARSIKSAIKSVEKSSGISIKSAAISVSGISLGSARSKAMIRTSKADGEITDHDIKRLVAQSEANITNVSNKSIIHSVPLFFKVDNNLVNGKPTEMKGSKIEVETFFATYLNIHLTELIKTVERVGIIIEDIVASPFAMSYAALTRQQKETGCVLANIGSSTVSIIVFEEGLPISLEVFPIGSSHITNDIALGLQVPLGEAERIKLQYGTEAESQSKKKISDISNMVESRLDDIFEMIEEHLKKISRNRILPAGIILTGSGSNLFNVDEFARARLKLPAKVGAFLPPKSYPVSISATPPNFKEHMLNDPGWTTAIGLCLYKSNEESAGYDGGRSENLKIIKNIKKWLKTLMP